MMQGLEVLQDCRSGSMACSASARLLHQQICWQHIHSLLRLCALQPAHTANRVLCALLLQALATEPPGVRAAVQEAVSALAAAYKGCTGDHWGGAAACQQRG
jgi:hypothetical protein